MPHSTSRLVFEEKLTPILYSFLLSKAKILIWKSLAPKKQNGLTITARPFLRIQMNQIINLPLAGRLFGVMLLYHY